MGTKEITSQQHPLVKRASLLRIDRGEREKEQRALIIGRKLITDLFSVCPLEILFFIGDEPPIQAQEKIRVSSSIFKKITALEESDGWAAIVHLPPAQSLFNKNFILVLDQISDPGNLGTLWRTALALGWEGIWLTPGCVDPFNDKALRAAQGTTFRLPFDRVTPEQIIEWLHSRKAFLYTADINGSLLDQCTVHPPLALLLGNEGHGPSSWTDAVSQKVTIPMNPAVESLNVASAGAILLYAMRPR